MSDRGKDVVKTSGKNRNHTGAAAPRAADNPAERMKDSRATVIVRCYEPIPCNPCESACPRNAIHIGTPISNLPKVDLERCIGCGTCVSACPGLAIIVVRPAQNPDEAIVMVPYEFLPRPLAGQQVMATDDDGGSLCDATVESCIETSSCAGTVAVCLRVPRVHAAAVQGFVWAKG